MKHNLDDLLGSSRHILLLQGPLGYFFSDFAQWLKKRNKTVFKMNFNAGDDYFYPLNNENTFSYTESINDFQQYLIHFCQLHQIDSIVCFGDTRPYHCIAKRVAEKLTMSFWAFEEGYFRPHYVTLEKNGVNAYSTTPRNQAFFLSLNLNVDSVNAPEPLAKGFLPMANLASRYYLAANCHKKAYPKYQHHRIYDYKYYIKLWVTSGIKRLYYWLHDKHFAKQVEQGKFGEFFITPLQVYDDSQVRVHSDFHSVGDFLETVLVSFANYAPKTTNLIVKHHPMDRGFIDYSGIIKTYTHRFPHLAGRIFYIHDVPMPVFLRYGKGMVTLNSTSGLSALLHNMPVKTLGRANYDFEGLTHQGDLDHFWQTPQKPNPLVFEAYHLYHLNKTQINGSFYSKVKLTD